MRVLSGMRPTGDLHIGHYVGAIDNWLKLQKKQESPNQTLFVSVDLHALTSNYASTKSIRQHSLNMIRDWIACGLDPQQSIIFNQSHVPQHTELFTFFSMITPLSWLERNPTFKELKQDIKDKDLAQLGFFSYPVLQAADIALYKADTVPVGQDQAPHLELSREIIRRFNHFYGEVFPEPQTVLTPTPKLNGSDGRKMSKSYNNAIALSDTPDVVEKKLKSYQTDVKRIKRQDSGEPNDCNLYPLHSVFSPKTVQEDVAQACRSAQIGCVDCKKKLLPNILEFLAPIATKQSELNKRPDDLQDILKKGQTMASDIAQNTMDQVKKAIAL